MHKYKKILCIVLLYTIFLTTVGCSKDEKKNPSQNMQESQKKEIEKTLSKLETETENLILGLWHKDEVPESTPGAASQEDEKNGTEKESESTDKKEDEENDKQGDQNNSTEEKQSEEKDKPEQSEENTSGKSGDQGRYIPENRQDGGKPQSWDEIKEIVEKLHIDWNTYEPQARKDGATTEMIYGVKEQLNILSEKVESRDAKIVLQEANKLYSHYPQFFNLYKHAAPPEVKKLKSMIRQIIIDVEDQNWNDIDRLLTNIDDIWLTAKSRMDKPDMMLNEKIEYAIEDLTNVTAQRKSSLVRLKGDILLQNLEQVK